MTFQRYATCPVCGTKPRSFWLFGDPTGESFWCRLRWLDPRGVEDDETEQVCITCGNWAGVIMEPLRVVAR